MTDRDSELLTLEMRSAEAGVRGQHPMQSLSLLPHSSPS